MEELDATVIMESIRLTGEYKGVLSQVKIKGKLEFSPRTGNGYNFSGSIFTDEVELVFSQNNEVNFQRTIFEEHINIIQNTGSAHLKFQSATFLKGVMIKSSSGLNLDCSDALAKNIFELSSCNFGFVRFKNFKFTQFEFNDCFNFKNCNIYNTPHFRYQKARLLS